MPTFLVTKSMPKALRARVESSLLADLRQRTLFPNRTRARKYVRVLLALGVVALAVSLTVTYRKSRREVEEQRASLLAEHGRIAASSTPADRARLRTWSEQLGARTASTQGPVGGRRELSALLERPFLYVRTDLDQLATPAKSKDSARESSLDALVMCLLMPPANLRESTLLRAVGRPLTESRAFAFAGVAAALDFLDSTFEGQVRTAEHMQELRVLSTRLHRPSLRHALTALDAEVLLLAVDHPKEAGVISDFDGEAPHDVQIMAWEISSGRLLYERKTRVDPSWISEKSRLAYSRSLDSCRLAHTLRTAPE